MLSIAPSMLRSSMRFRDHHVTAYLLGRPGSELPAFLMVAGIVIVCLLAGRLSGALLAALGLAVSEGLTEYLLKPLVHRTYLGSLVYPSGHMTAIAALASTVTRQAAGCVSRCLAECPVNAKPVLSPNSAPKRC
jgi:hypothetical protein